MIKKSLRAYITSRQLIFGILAYSKVVRFPLGQLLKHEIDRVLKFLIVLPYLHRVDKFNESREVLFLHRGLIMDIADQGAIQKCLRLQPEIVPALAFAFGIGNQGGNEFQDVLFTMDVRERIILQGSFMIAVTLFQSLGKAKKATWLVLFRQIILFIPLCVVLPMIGGMGIRGVWLAIALTDAILVVITVSMMLYEFGKLPETSSVNR